MILRLISDDHTLQQRFIPVYRPEGIELVQHMMVRYDYTSRTARLRNRIAISYHQNSKNECLPSGFIRFMLIHSSKAKLILHFSFFVLHLIRVFI